MTGLTGNQGDATSDLDHDADERFVDYYRDKSESDETLLRSQSMYDTILQIRSDRGSSTEALKVADIGCGPGAQSIFWAQRGHYVRGLDVSADFIDVATDRAKKSSLSIEFHVGTAAELPWDDQSFDVCLAPELLEHVSEWEDCLDEFARILRPGGLLYINTSNKLCPAQNEFELPLYSWYPGPIKRYCEKLAVTTKPHFANYATYPAVNWFTYYGLRQEFRDRNMSSLDRSDLLNIKARSGIRQLVARTIRHVAPIRFMVQMFTPYTLIIGIKSES